MAAGQRREASSAAAGLLAWAAGRGVATGPLLGGVLLAGADDLGVAVPGDEPLLAEHGPPAAPTDLPVAGGEVGPDLLGAVLEADLDRSQRRRGAVFTPRATAEGVVRVALAALADADEEPTGAAVRSARVGPPTVLDPAVGGGAFCLALARAQAAAGHEPGAVVASVRGLDLLPASAAVARASVGLWAAAELGRWVPATGIGGGDALGRPPAAPADRVDLVVGNPPFQGQLRRRTVRGPERLAWVRARFGASVGAYVDTASLFLLAALDEVRDGGVIALVQPRSFLGSAGSAGARGRLRAEAALVDLWDPQELAFSAAVRVCAPVLVRGGAQPDRVRSWSDLSLAAPPTDRPSVEVLGPGPSAPIVPPRLADAVVPLVEGSAAGVLGDRAVVTAGFRDQYYALVPAVSEAAGPDDPRPRLMLSGLIDPGAHRWGRGEARFAKRRWRAPVVDPAMVGGVPRMARWVEARLVPKVVVASQTRVLEAVADPDGSFVPCTPTVSVEPEAEPDGHGPPLTVAELLVVVLGPPASAWVHARSPATGLSDDTVRVSARVLATLPLPVDAGAWAEAVVVLAARRGAALAADEASLAFGELMGRAHGLDRRRAARLAAWWWPRLPVVASRASEPRGPGR